MNRKLILIIGAVLLVVASAGGAWYVLGNNSSGTNSINSDEEATDFENKEFTAGGVRTQSDVKASQDAAKLGEPAPAGSPCAGQYEVKLSSGTYCTHGTD
jgi:hypothetical protein